MGECYAQVIVSLKNPEVDRIFDYRVPGTMENFQIGLRVIVPFGMRNNRTEGYVVGISETTQVPPQKLKNILQVMDEGKPIFSKEMLMLAQWMKEKYFCTLSQCLQAIMPAGIKSKSIWMVRALDGFDMTMLSKEEAELLAVLEKSGKTAVDSLKESWGEGLWKLLKEMAAKGVVALSQQTNSKSYKMEEKKFALSDDLEKYKELLDKIEKNQRMDGQKRVIEYLMEGKQATAKELKEKCKISDSPIQTLLKNGILMETHQEIRRDVISHTVFESNVMFQPTPEQAIVLQALEEEFKKEIKRPVLLHGVTGSGKTELYMQMIAKVLQQGKQAIVLVPEISLTPQIVGRFFSRFGNQVSVTHSRMSYAQRYDQWKKARDHEINVMIGPRSALFTPMKDLGILILDEEHEGSYRSDTTPKYDAKEVAEKLAQLTGSLLLMGSATPDLTTYHKTITGEYRLLEMQTRTNGGHMPEVFITDMRKELEEGNRSMFSRQLYQAISENLEQKQQTILFLNRRGHSTFVSCRKCGYVMECDECSVSYTYHAKENELICHYCGKHVPNPKVCPACGSKYIKYFGTGTQRVEGEVKKLFPAAAVLRMDLDTTTKKNSHEEILQSFAKGEADILIGTQMIAKGHDFPNVTLVGIVAADLSLHSNSYNASETNFQLITQAAGRAGRAELPGRVFIQTYQPEHYSIVRAAKQDYKGFFEEEVKLRELMAYPPFSNIFTVLMTGKEEKLVIDAAHELGRIMVYYNKKGRFTLLGPSPAAISKMKNEYRWRIIIKCTEEEALKNFVLYCMDKWKLKKWNGVYVNLTMNPLTIV